MLWVFSFMIGLFTDPNSVAVSPITKKELTQIIDSYTGLAYDEDPDNLIELYDTLRYISDVENDNNISAELKSIKFFA